ncbi:MAG TPA: M1 family metallopeptidase [Gemmatimonadaceae bacterium]|nr:M1 family metallopeptidase [Gemmatimonadaceae bacterium]
MTTTALCALLLAFQQGANTTPASGDTVGYWQQHVHYQIVATLDEAAHVVHGVADLTYVNHSPDTLHEMYFHQYLNAFRPGSKWSAVDEREGRVRFQDLQNPDFGYERFTAVPTFDGVPVAPDYPGASDSTVAHFALPHPVAPGDSIRVHLQWDARPSTVLRRQGRKGRSYDFAQWYPKVAVYDRGGWEPNPFVPSGELYGEFGTYDVTLVVAADQVIGATGVPVAGDPGWERVKRWGTLYIPREAYDSVPPAPEAALPEGDKAVRFFARNVHHFAWSVSPDYRYEGGIFVRRVPRTHFKTWDTVAVNVLYRPGDDSTWGNGIAVRRSIQALAWLEKIWGPYAWPTFTNLHRLEGGGTEFPMMIMDGSDGLPLILHETGHQFTYGILANNEWRSGWMDEGLTSYQTSWALGQTPQQLAQLGPPMPPLLGVGYRAYATTMSPEQARGLGMVQRDIEGHTQPIGTPAYDFRDFGTYNAMIYTRGELMYSQLRDVLGDSVFQAFFHDYYNRWALKHVDERAMEASAERVSGRKLDWFFDEWVHRVGLVDYALTEATTSQQPDGRWLTQATIVRRGAYEHPMPVGVRTDSGWTIARGAHAPDEQTVSITTAGKPLEVRLDPWHTTYDWDRRNDVVGPALFGLSGAQAVFDWPFLDQASRDHSLVALSPLVWYSETGALTLGMRARTSYLNLVDRYDFGLAVTSASRATASGAVPVGISRVQGWLRFENPYIPDADRPLMGLKGGGALLDGIAKLDLAQTWDLSTLWTARGPRMSATLGAVGAYIYDQAMVPAYWERRSLTEVNGAFSLRAPAAAFDAGDGDVSVVADVALGFSPLPSDRYLYRPVTPASPGQGPQIGFLGEGATPTLAGASSAYGRVELAVGSMNTWDAGDERLALRLYGGLSNDPPAQRALHVSATDPLANFENDWYRPNGSILTRPGLNYLPLGGAGLRGYDQALTAKRIVAANGELSQRLATQVFSELSLWGSLFGDAGFASSDTYQLNGSFLADAGVGLALRGRLYDRDVTFRLDAPLIVQQPALAGGGGLTHGHATIAVRWTFGFADLW